MSKLTITGLCMIGAVMLSFMVMQLGFNVEIPKPFVVPSIAVGVAGLALTIIGVATHKKNFSDSKDYRHQTLGG